LEEGAARVAAFERQRFEVTDYLSRATIVVKPKALEDVFPMPVCERIRSKLGVPQSGSTLSNRPLQPASGARGTS
jgi:hypothetical protein